MGGVELQDGRVAHIGIQRRYLEFGLSVLVVILLSGIWLRA